MALTERLQILVTADAKGAANEFKKIGVTAERELGKTDDRLKKLSSGLTSFGVQAGIAGGIATAGVFSLAQAAGDYEEAASRAGVIFGDASETIEDFGKSAIDSAGLSRRAAVEASNTFGVFGKTLGLTGDDLTGFSTDLAQLAGDMASFANTSTDEAIQSISSALRGEMDPIEKYGIILNDAALKQEAMALGIYEGNAALTSQQKIVAVNSLLFKQSADAQGDYARTSDSLSNQTKTLSAEIENMKIAVGEGAVPVFSELVGALNSGLSAFQDLSPETQSLVGKLGAIGAIGVTAAGGLALIVGGGLRAVDTFRDLGGRLRTTSGDLTRTGRAATVAGAAIGGAGLALAALQAASAFNDSTRDLKQFLDTVDSLRFDGTESDVNSLVDAIDQANGSIDEAQNRWLNWSGIVGTVDIGGVSKPIVELERTLDAMIDGGKFEQAAALIDIIQKSLDEGATNENFSTRNQFAELADEVLPDYRKELDRARSSERGSAASSGKLADKVEGLGDVQGDAADASEQLGEALERAGRQAKLSTVGIDAAAAAGAAFGDSIENATSADDLLSSGLGVASALRSLQDGFTGGADAAEDAADETDTLSDALDALDDSLQRADPAFSSLGIAMGKAEAAAAGFSDSIEDSTALDDQLGAAVNLGEAFDNFEKSAKRLPPTIDLMGIALGNLKPRQRDAVNDLLALADASKDYLSSLIEGGASTGQVAAEAGQLRDALREQLVQLGLNEQQIQEFIKTAGLLPEQVTTALKVSGADAARFEIESHLQLLEGRIPESVATSVSAKINAGDLDGAANQLAGLAASNPPLIIDVDSSEIDKAKEKLFSLPKSFDPAIAAVGGYTEEQENALAAVQNLGEGVQDYLTSLVESGQTDKAVAEAARLREEYRKQFEQYGITGAAFDTYADKLLNLDGKVIQVAVELADETQLLTEIQLLTQLMSAELKNNPDLQALITAQVNQGDLAGARGVLAAFGQDIEDGFINDPILIAAGLSTDDANQGLADWRDYVSNTPPVDAKVGADTTEADDDVMLWQWITNQAEATVTVDANTAPAYAKLQQFFRDAATPMFDLLDTISRIPSGGGLGKGSRPPAGNVPIRGGGRDGDPSTSFHSGGMVDQVPVGREVSAVLLGGERVLTAEQNREYEAMMRPRPGRAGSMGSMGGGDTSKLEGVVSSLEMAVRESSGWSVHVDTIVAPTPERVPEALLASGKSAAWMAGV